jgi:succinate dehydrogenase/fumarate reductase flavoprotein subunit
MASVSHINERVPGENHDIALTADVLVIGGGPAGCWAALAAAHAGAKVVVAEKGYLGTSGTQVAAGTNAYHNIPTDPVQREGMIASRLPLAFGFADMEWIEKVYDQSFRGLDLMARWGYAFPKATDGREKRGNLRAADGIMFLRWQLEKAGVTILDHSPSLELLISDGVAAGAVGVNRKKGGTWIVRAGAVVLATGGTGFRSGIAGGHNNTGDGYLFASEVGAEFSGMEFSSQWAIVPKDSACSKTAVYNSATMTDANGQEVSRGKGTTIAEIQTGALFVKLDKFSDQGRRMMQASQPHTFEYFWRHSKTDPFTESYQCEHLLEGTIRASGGIAVGSGSATTVPGLYAAGDTTSREKLVGAAQSGAGPATAWAIASGSWAGHFAYSFAQRFGNSSATRKVKAVGGAGIRPNGKARADLRAIDIEHGVQREMLPVATNYRRSEETMTSSLKAMEGHWKDLRDNLGVDETLQGADLARAQVKAREAAAMVQTARIILNSGLERKESRGLHRRSDYGTLDPNQHQHVIASGLDEIAIRRKPVVNSYLDRAAS